LVIHLLRTRKQTMNV